MPLADTNWPRKCISGTRSIATRSSRFCRIRSWATGSDRCCGSITVSGPGRRRCFSASLAIKPDSKSASFPAAFELFLGSPISFICTSPSTRPLGGAIFTSRLFEVTGTLLAFDCDSFPPDESAGGAPPAPSFLRRSRLRNLHTI